MRFFNRFDRHHLNATLSLLFSKSFQRMSCYKKCKWYWIRRCCSPLEYHPLYAIDLGKNQYGRKQVKKHPLSSDLNVNSDLQISSAPSIRSLLKGSRARTSPYISRSVLEKIDEDTVLQSKSPNSRDMQSVSLQLM